MQYRHRNKNACRILYLMQRQCKSRAEPAKSNLNSCAEMQPISCKDSAKYVVEQNDKRSFNENGNYSAIGIAAIMLF